MTSTPVLDEPGMADAVPDPGVRVPLLRIATGRSGDKGDLANIGLLARTPALAAVLGGTGGTSTLRYDPQGKSYAAMLLAMPVDVPVELLDDLA